jgi:class 3 adenylate cyclase/tetratricopeptide (TPR) repeat protein
MAEARKTVTIVFSDVSGSTTLGEELDPETVRRVMRRYFDEAQAVLERHGGTVEKFIGDAVMAVFGIPQLHEDDALRAIRAAAELRLRLSDLNEELARDWGVRIAVRTGVNTGEVVAGDSTRGDSFATGDAVNVAARLEQAASPGEILVGEATVRLLHEAVRVEAVEPLAVKGKAEPVAAWRLLEVLPDVPAYTRKLDAPFVGRISELAALEQAFQRSAEEGTCRLVTVLGPPGVGKSRLARELLAAVRGRARVVVGRCLPYGEGITYWPLAEIVEQVSGRDYGGMLDLVGDDEHAELIAARIASAVGLAPPGGRSEEVSWAVRRLLESLSRQRPLVVVFDDIHWAEPTFLDLIEYLAGFTAGPVLLLALARPDLLETRASWTTPRPNASAISLEPLSEGEADALIDRLSSGAGLSESTRAQIVEISSGNPLFLEQILALQVEGNGDSGELVVPPTIQALLAARIDRLDPGERAVIERAAIEGRSFHRGAVSELLPETARPTLGADLMSLVRKELIRPDRAVFAGDDGFRFAHVLVRDAAYAAMAKERRAELHEQYAGWLARAAEGRMTEYEEIVGYHLERAHVYRAELGPVDERGRALARRASECLVSAAERAIARGDRPAQVSLLSRAAPLLTADERSRVEVLAELADALTEMGDFPRAEAVLAEAIAGAETIDDPGLEARASLALAKLRYATKPGEIADHRRRADGAIQVFERDGDEFGLARAWNLRADLQYGQGQSAAAEEAWRRSIEYARRAGSRREELAALSSLASIALWGPAHRTEGLERCEEILGRVRGNMEEEANVLGLLGCLRALEGRFDDAHDLLARRAAIFEELGLQLAEAWRAHTSGWVELLAGDAAAAESILRAGYETLERTGAETQLQVVGSYLVRAMAIEGRYAEVESLALFVEDLDPSGIAEIALARSARGTAVAHQGRASEGERLTREAVEIIDQTDFLIDRADARVNLGDVLLLADRVDDAVPVLAEALELHEAKGNVVSAASARALLESLGR